jgi:hypothetical protein
LTSWSARILIEKLEWKSEPRVYVAPPRLIDIAAAETPHTGVCGGGAEISFQIWAKEILMLTS